MDWLPQWDRVVIVASGPSAQFLAPLAPRPGWAVLAINESWRLVPWADALYACDADWWKHRNGVPEFRGLKISQDELACEAYPDVKRVYLEDRNEFLFDEIGTIGSGGNSSFQALNIAAQAGAKKIILVGVDMTAEHGSHWHGDHQEPLRNTTPLAYTRMIAAFIDAAPVLKARGIDVVNVSRDSALPAFRKSRLCQEMN